MQEVSQAQSTKGVRKVRIEQAKSVWEQNLTPEILQIISEVEKIVQQFNPDLSLHYVPTFIAWKSEKRGKSDYFSVMRGNKKRFSIFIKFDEVVFQKYNQEFASKNATNIETNLVYIKCYKAYKLRFTKYEIAEGKLDDYNKMILKYLLERSFYERLKDNKVSRTRLYQ